MKLYSITVMLKTPNSGARLLFNDDKSANEAFRLLSGFSQQPLQLDGTEIMCDKATEVCVRDTYGNAYAVTVTDIASVLFTDMAAECEGQKELEMLTAHMKADLFDRMSKDDKVKAMQRAMNPGNGILGGGPGGLGGGPFRQ